ncbi:hypothetical protein [Nocardia vinacea]|uniref:hypothetical protein n=1 Tax=Nocardia vinacea TaxID=96468 RepID=UPI0012F6A35F|nr:hypothetical protein [Nocardia vinacea]
MVIELAGANEPRPDVDAPTVPPGLWRRWFTSVTLGELLGFAAPAMTGALVRDAAPLAAAVALMAAVMAAITGYFLVRILRAQRTQH